MAYLKDDGTLDTVIVCDDCGREHRFNYDSSAVWQGGIEPTDAEAMDAYREWVDECCDEVDEMCDHDEDNGGE